MLTTYLDYRAQSPFNKLGDAQPSHDVSFLYLALVRKWVGKLNSHIFRCGAETPFLPGFSLHWVSYHSVDATTISLALSFIILKGNCYFQPPLLLFPPPGSKYSHFIGQCLLHFLCCNGFQIEME